jgi:hypothetical protein
MSFAGALLAGVIRDGDPYKELSIPTNKIQTPKLKAPTTPTGAPRGYVANVASGSPFINRSGLYNINENGAELGIHKPARGSYTFLTHGDGILNAGLTRNIMALAQNPELAIHNVLGHILASGNNTTTNAQSQIITIQNVNLPNVNNATQFVKQLQLISQNH